MTPRISIPGPWLAMHTSGRSSPDGFGRCSGILFPAPEAAVSRTRGILDLDPGRLAVVQATSRLTRLPVSIIGLYQHVLAQRTVNSQKS